MLREKRPSGLDLFRARLENLLSHQHPLFILAGQIDWPRFETDLGPLYADGIGRPAKDIRLMVGVHYLKHAFKESDESVVERLLENPYWQYFCGFEYFQHELPVDPTTMVKWRQRIGEERFEILLQETIKTAERTGQTRSTTFRHVNVDTTVQEKAIAHPTDARLYHKMLVTLLAMARQRGMTLRRSYVRVSKTALHQHGRYCHAKQFRRARKPLRQLKTWLQHVVRDVEKAWRAEDQELGKVLSIARQILSQTRSTSPKVYSIHEPQVACIAKGKARKRYEFGCKVGVVTSSDDNWVLAVQAFPGNPYDGHTLGSVLEKVADVTGVVPVAAYVDRGYRGHGLEGSTEIHIAGSRGRKPLTRTQRRRRRRRVAIEPVIGHLKTDHRMDRNPLKGLAGDRINAILAACGYNIRKLMRGLVPCLLFWVTLRRLPEPAVA